MNSFLIGSIALLGFIANATASTTVTFDNNQGNWTIDTSPVSSFTDSGLLFTSSQTNNADLAVFSDSGAGISNDTTNALVFGNTNEDSFTISLIGGGTFTLQSADFAASSYAQASNFYILVNGSRLNIDTTLTTNVFNITGTSITISGPQNTTGHFLMDNIVYSVTPVPEPETFAMLGLGLGILGLVSRRKKLSH